MIGSALIDAQRQSIEFTANFQERVVKANQELADSLTGMVDTLPLPDVKAPTLIDTDFVGQAFDITSEWLQLNRQFTEDLVAAWMPKTPKKAKK